MGEKDSWKLLEPALSQRKSRIMSYIFSRPEIALFEPDHLREASLQYLQLGGKSLRPAVLLFCCGAVGGDEDRAMAAAAAVEVYHTWTLIHDDVIDRDPKRRGRATVHEGFRQEAEKTLGYTPTEAAHYGISVAILAGDMLQGWCASLLSDIAYQPACDPLLPLQLTKDLLLRTQASLVAGQLRDVQFEQVPVESLTEQDILDMLMGKTGALYDFCGRAGAMIGLNSASPNQPQVKALSSFTRQCGLAFQLQDDILGVVGNEALLGKPVGSDIREGKKTLIVHHALQHANERQRSVILGTLGNQLASPEEIRVAVQILVDVGSLQYAQKRASGYVAQATDCLADLPSSYHKELLLAWADFIVSRKF